MQACLQTITRVLNGLYQMVKVFYLWIRYIYWKKSQREVLAIVEQLGCPTFFLTLSCADLRWNKLVEIISKLNSSGPTKENVEGLNYFERCNILNSNAVLLARHFQYRVEIFFKEILIIRDGPLWTEAHHIYIVLFGYSMLQHLRKHNKWIYWIFRLCSLWKFAIRRRGFTFVSIGKTFQIHCHSQPCPKYKNSKCRFTFGRFFTDKTIISIPLQHTLNQVDKFGILSKRNNILGQVKKYIDNNNLDPNSRSFSNDLSIQEVLSSMGITEDYYYWTLSISTGKIMKFIWKEAQAHVLLVIIIQFYWKHGKQT